MACDSLQVLGQLVRTGLWSRASSLRQFKRIVVDVESVVSSLYRRCIQVQSSQNQKHQQDLYSSTLVDYVHFGRLVNQLLDYFHQNGLEPHLVYEGKFMEAPLFGLLAAQFTKNSQKVVETIKARLQADRQQQSSASFGAKIISQPELIQRPNLALIVFKLVVNVRRKTGANIHAHQAFYTAYPLLAKLARDLKCPVLTNQGDFIIMDVRAGFILFDELWTQQVTATSKRPPSAATRGSSRSPSASISDSKIKSPSKRSPSAGAASFSSASSSAMDHQKGANLIRFHYSILFLHQHPGLNPPLAMSLFPLTTVDFATRYSKALKGMRVFNTEYTEKDFVQTSSSGSKRLAYKRHHLAANRLEMVLTFLAGKTVHIMGNLIRSEATRTNTSFDTDFNQLFNYHAIAHEFKFRLRFILKYLHDPLQLNFIESCLIHRECTADYLLPQLCCSIGHLASISYNRTLQFEDLQTKHSAFAPMNHHKAMLMSLFSSNKSHKSEQSLSSKSSSSNKDTTTRYATAHLTLVDRQRAEVVELTASTTHHDEELDAIRSKISLDQLARRQVNKRDAVRFIQLAFKSKDLLSLDQKAAPMVNKYLGPDEHQLRNELAIARHLFSYAFNMAAADDDHFKAHYTEWALHFQLALLNHYLYLGQTLTKHQHQEVAALVDLILKQDADHQPMSLPATTAAAAPKAKKSPKSSSKSQSVTNNAPASKQVRHLIELLNSALEAYCELNAFFDYPLPRLNLHLHYNPILIYNLTLLASSRPQPKALIK